MSKRILRVREGEPLFDIVSFGRGGARDNGGRLTPEQVEQIRRTVQRVPEAVVKVLPRATNSLQAAGKHLDYIGRYGMLELESDGGEHLQGRIGKTLVENWDLDIDEDRPRAALTSTNGGKPPKLIHKLMFSMPPGTPPKKVLAAVRNFAREQFAFQHRYAFVLHTDEAHPHVHLVLKAVSERGVRPNIKKVTLRHWRSEFARHLRLLGVPANATERALRGDTRKAKKDGIYRASLRGDSTHLRAQAEAVAAEVLNGRFSAESGKKQVAETRRRIESGWRDIGDRLVDEGLVDLANDVRRFVGAMSAAHTDREWVAASLLKATHRRERERARALRSR